MVNENQTQFLLVGALHVDEIATPEAELTLGESNPVTWERRVGGVAANAARAAVQTSQNVTVSLVANFGADPDGNALVSTLEACRVRVCSISKTCEHAEPTGRYTAILHKNGEVLVGLVDASQAEAISSAAMQEPLSTLKPAALLIDGNVAEQTWLDLTYNFNQLFERPIWVAALAVSPAKISRLLPILPSLNVLFCNYAEAKSIQEQSNQTQSIMDEQRTHTGSSHPNSESPMELVKTIGRLGSDFVIMTHGKHGVYIASAEETVHLGVSEIAHAKTLNGAGDALAGASMAYLVNKQPSFEHVVDAVKHHGIPAAKTVLNGVNRAPLLSPTSTPEILET